MYSHPGIDVSVWVVILVKQRIEFLIYGFCACTAFSQTIIQGHKITLYGKSHNSELQFGWSVLLLDLKPILVQAFPLCMLLRWNFTHIFWVMTGSVKLPNFERNTDCALLCRFLTLILPIATYANSLDPDKTPSYSASHPNQNCLTLGQYFHQLWMALKFCYTLIIEVVFIL